MQIIEQGSCRCCMLLPSPVQPPYSTASLPAWGLSDVVAACGQTADARAAPSMFSARAQEPCMEHMIEHASPLLGRGRLQAQHTLSTTAHHHQHLKTPSKRDLCSGNPACARSACARSHWLHRTYRAQLGSSGCCSCAASLQAGRGEASAWGKMQLPGGFQIPPAAWPPRHVPAAVPQSSAL